MLISLSPVGGAPTEQEAVNALRRSAVVSGVDAAGTIQHVGAGVAAQHVGKVVAADGVGERGAGDVLEPEQLIARPRRRRCPR